ncbi:asparaginase [Streptomyces sp. B6B3]|uniref:asparaginase n=1 Tax=Streptomyces sp. B6B3 TaxID=3153570 RepID=UPI00325DFBFA
MPDARIPPTPETGGPTQITTQITTEITTETPAETPAEARETPGAAPPVLAEVVRSGFVESRHRGSLVVLGPDGSVERALGDVVSPVFPRSSNKPMQAAAMLAAGARLADERLALASASHSGEPFHQGLVAEVLAAHGLGEEDLVCPPALPLDGATLEAQLASGRGRTRIAMNCSGKHAGMLAACVAGGWPTAGYTDPGHPFQRLVLATVEAATGEPVAHIGVDGCGAPLLGFSLTGLARAFRGLVRAAPGSPARRVADAMRAHPEYVAGTGQPDTLLMRAVPGALSKAGAEGVQAVALPDGRAVAFKLEDGSARARGPVVAAALTALGVAPAALAPLADVPVYGGSSGASPAAGPGGGAARVGEVRATI